jgi:hypothetical protein
MQDQYVDNFPTRLVHLAGRDVDMLWRSVRSLSSEMATKVMEMWRHVIA